MPNFATASVELVANTGKFSASMQSAKQEASSAFREMKAQAHEANASIALIGDTVGVKLPRHLRAFVSELPGVATAMSAAFNAVAVIALASFVIEATKKVMELAEKSAEAGKKAREAFEGINLPLRDTNDALQVTNDKLRMAIDKFNGKQNNGFKLALDEALVSADNLSKKLNEDLAKMAGVMKEKTPGWWGQQADRAMGEAPTSDLSKKYDEYATKLRDIGDAGHQAAKEAHDKGDLAGEKAAISKANMQLIDTSKAAEQWFQKAAMAAQAVTNEQKSAHKSTMAIAMDQTRGQFNSLNQGARLNMASGNAEFFGNKAENIELQGENATLTGIKATEGAKPKKDDWLKTMLSDDEKEVASQKRVTEAITVEYLARLKLEEAADKKQEQADAERTREFIKNRAEMTAAMKEFQSARRQDAGEDFSDQVSRSKFNVQMGSQTKGQANADIRTAAADRLRITLESLEVEKSAEEITAKEVAAIEKEEDKARYEYRKVLEDQSRQQQLESMQRIKEAMAPINDELAKLMTGQHTNWKQMFTGEADSLAKKALGGLESVAMGALGIGKADGSDSNPFSVKIKGGPGGAGGLGAVLGLGSSSSSSSSGGGFVSLLEKFFGIGGGGGGAASVGGGGAISAEGGGAAFGGDLTAGLSYDVGEMGRERFTPTVNGRITPNNKLSGAGAVYDFTGANFSGSNPADTEMRFQRALAQVHGSAVASSAQVQRETRMRQPRSKW